MILSPRQDEKSKDDSVSRRSFLSKVVVAGVLGSAGIAVGGSLLPSVEGTTSTDVEESGYIIHTDAGTVKARNGNTGNVDFSDSNATTVIQSVLNSASVDSIVIKGPATYLVNTLTMANVGRLIGQGKPILKLNANTVGHVLTTVAGLANLEIRGLEIDGNKANQTHQIIGSSEDPNAQGGIVFLDTTDSIIDSCYV